MRTALIIPAAGYGKRFSPNVKKQFYTIFDKPVLYWTIKNMVSAYAFDEIVLGINYDDLDGVKDILKELDVCVPVKYAQGGAERSETVRNAVAESSADICVIHDGVRPFVSKRIAEQVINKAIATGAAICALPVRDTVKRVIDGVITDTVSRDNLYLAHTPQAFKREVILKALNTVSDKGVDITDDASACEYCGIDVGIIPSDYENIKVTYAEDIDIIETLMKKFF